MSQLFEIHAEKPQARLIRKAVEIIRQGGVIAYPTDSCYALACRIGDREALQRICRIRNLGDRHNFTIICRDLSEIATYASIDNRFFRLLKANTPGAYTFILKATREAPRLLLHPKRKTIGLRMPASPIAQALLGELDQPMLTTSMILPGETEPLADAIDIRQRLQHELDLVIDGGHCGNEPTTMVDLTGSQPVVVRVGEGDPTPFE